jgi:hypothetical protein
MAPPLVKKYIHILLEDKKNVVKRNNQNYNFLGEEGIF